jgi:uncharacterized protein
MSYLMKFHLGKTDRYDMKARTLFGFFYFLLMLAASGSSAFAQDIPARPEPPRLVNDFAGVLNADEIRALEAKLVAFNDSTSTQITVVIVPTLNGYEKSDYAYRLGQQWGVGQKDKNNGAVVLIKPKTGNEKGEAYIATGYGLEGVIPDALAKRIVENEMIPAFRQNDYYGGVNAAVTTMISLAKGEYTAEQYTKRTKNDAKPYGILVPLIILIIVFMTIRGSRAKTNSIGKNIPFWTAFWLLGSMGRGHSGSWNNFSSGSGGFGGGGGGGFGGFGGGSFGGGGAGGSW